ncbi:MAG: sporulation protein [Bacteroidales bacterium]|nr:sporulation protein [Bacteroidales bacterium]
MGFFQKMKNKMGIGGVKVQLSIPEQAPKADGSVEGKVILTSKSDQEIKKIEIKMVEEYTTGRGDDKETKELTMGEININEAMAIKEGETKEIPFSLPYTILKSNNDELKEKGGALGAIGKVGSFAKNEKSKYFIEADVDVVSAAIDPSDREEIKLV